MSLFHHYRSKARMAGGRASPYNFGGDSSSDSSTRTSDYTTNQTAYTDKRNTVGDTAVGVSGDGNAIDRSQTTTFIDTSTKSTTDLTSFLDQSNRSTNFTDNSNRSVTTINSSTDYGAIKDAVGLSSATTTKAFDTAQLGIKGAIDTLQLQTKVGSDIATQAFDLAKSSAANSGQTIADVLGFASKEISTTADAFAQAKDSGQAKMVMYALGAIAVIGVAFAMKR